jgi:succinate-acetate transporter protein
MDTQINRISVNDSSGNPAPLGLMAFGMTTVLLNLHNAGFFSLSTMILAMGIFYGGIAQIITGIMEWKKGNTFGTVAFTSYGLFWLTLVGLLIMPSLGWGAAADKGGLIAFYFMWGLFTSLMFVGTLKLTRALQVVFGSLAVLFFLLALRDITGSEIIGKLTGYEGIFCGISAIYTSIAQIWNEIYKKQILPLGIVKK